MSAYPKIKFRYHPETTYQAARQANYMGAQTEVRKRGFFPMAHFSDLPILSMVVHENYIYQICSQGVTFDLYRIDAKTGESLYLLSLSSSTGVLACDGTYLYVAGEFTSPALRLIRYPLSTLTGNNTGVWDSTFAPAPDSDVRAMIVAGDVLVVGGDFLNIAGVGRTRLAALNLSDGTATALNKACNDEVLTIAYCPAGVDGATAASVIIGGDFTTVGGTGRNRIAEVGLDDTLRTWNPGAAATVRAVLYDEVAFRVYAGGDFNGATSLAGATFNYAGCIGAGGGAQAWNPNLNGAVYAMLKVEERIYLGGQFTTASGGTARPAACSFDTTGSLRAFNPALTPDGVNVRCIVGYQKTVYYGGDFVGWATFYPEASPNTGYFVGVPDPCFKDANTAFVSKTGSDSNAGTHAAPKLTIAGARAILGAVVQQICILDSGVYDETAAAIGTSTPFTWGSANLKALVALDGYAPSFASIPGVDRSVVGSKRTGRTKFYAGAGTTYHVKKGGLGVTGLTEDDAFQDVITAGLAAAAGDCIQIDDDETYSMTPITLPGALTIQAKSGYIPTLYIPSATGSIITGTGNVALYGLTLVSDGTATNYAVSNAGNMEAYDCTFIGFTKALQPSAASSYTLDVYRCSFIDFSDAGIYINSSSGAGAKSIRECLFTARAGNTVVDTTPGAGVDVNLAGMTGTVTLDKLTFENLAQTYALVIRKNNAAAATVNATRIEVLNCKARGIGILHQAGNGGPVVYFRNVAISGCGRAGIHDEVSGGLSFTAGTFTEFTVRGCNTSFADYGGVQRVGAITSTVSFVNGVSAGNYGAGFAQVCSVTNSMQMTRCAALGNIEILQTVTVADIWKNGVGFWCFSANANMNLDNCISAGNPISSFQDAGVAISVSSYTVYDTITFRSGLPANVWNYSGVGVVIDDPGVISSFGTADNAALNPGSPALGKSGPAYSLISADLNFAYDAVLDGIIFDLPRSSYGAIIRSSPGSDSLLRVQNCSFTGDGLHGVWCAGGIRVSGCKFENSSMGVVIQAPLAKVDTSTFQGNIAGVAVGVPGVELANLSAHACGWGVFDQPGATEGDYHDLVLSDSGIYDYEGQNEATYSCIGTLGPNASVDANSIRKNPLFRDPDNGDLRLLAIADGGLNDSPAVGVGTDEADMGAFSFIYGASETTYYVIDFNSTDNETVPDHPIPFINPSRISHSDIPVKIAEEDVDDGALASKVSAYKLQHVMSWDSSSAMPRMQLEQLRTMFRDPSNQVQFQLDGCTWVPAYLVKANGFEYEHDPALGWNTNEAPLPLKQLVVREA